ncbi:aldo/keto reductase [bacterium]|nr:MAG: aldo/keto reductase [bacterium]
MPYRRLGRSGLPVSALSFGSWVTFGAQMNLDAATASMRRAYERGVNFFDNAEAYAGGESETLMGQALKKEGWSRDSYIVSSKVFWGGDRPTQRGLNRKHMRDACDAALGRLQVDYLDLYFCHRPDIDTPIEEVVFTMDQLIRAGKVLYWGTSEWSAQQIQEAVGVASANHLHAPTMEQPQYHMFHRERVEGEYAPLYESVGLGTTIWSPLASGMLTGKYRDGIPQGSRPTLPGYEWLREHFENDKGKGIIAKARELEPIAGDLDCSTAQLAIAWCLLNPHVSTVILGASNIGQLDENLDALEVLPRLTDDVVTRIEGVLQNRPDGPKRF